MTAEEKANSLMYQFSVVGGDRLTHVQAKYCSIFHVNEILSLLPDPPGSVSGGKKEFYEELKEHLLNQ